MGKIIIATDLSAAKDAVINTGITLAKKMNVKVEFLTIINQYIEYMPVDVGVDFSDQWEAREFIAKAELEKIRQLYDDVDITISVFVGDPKKDTIKHAIEQKASMIILGTQGRTGLEHLMVGSTAEYIIRHSPIPVLVVPIKNYLH